MRVATFRDLDKSTLYAILRLRSEIFVVEQRCAYLDPDSRDTEPTTRHLRLRRDGEILAHLPGPIPWLADHADGSLVTNAAEFVEDGMTHVPMIRAATPPAR